MSGATSFANSQTGISFTPIYYQIKWTEDDPLSPGAQVFTEDNPLNQTLSNQITWTNNSVTEQQNVSQDFFNSL